jgi:hypothetical protein
MSNHYFPFHGSSVLKNLYLTSEAQAMSSWLTVSAEIDGGYLP